MSEQRAVARAVDALRRGWPICVDGVCSLLPVEMIGESSLEVFDPKKVATILITSGRAATLKLSNQLAAAAPDAPVMIARATWADASLVRAIADPALDLSTPLKGPFNAVNLENAKSACAAALILARHAGLLPAYYVLSGRSDDVADVLSEDILAYEAPHQLRIVARAKLPIAATDHAEIIAFRTEDAGQDHIALLIGQPNGQPPLVRLHSECLTGDVLGSLKCDCGPQLDAALRLIAASGWGVLLYMRQEGRGIGLVNKLRAYALQDQGFDTVDANVRLGFSIDARDFGLAARMLHLLGQTRARLLTNNPDKVARLEENGIEIIERVPHSLPPNPYNQRYLDVKRDRTGHRL